MSHIHTEPGQHDHTVSIYLVRTDFNEPKIMLHFHSKMKIYAQFGGHIELNENPWKAATHELREEAGYDIDELTLLQPQQRLKNISGAVVHPQPVVHATMGFPTDKSHFHTDSVYAVIANKPPTHLPEDGESTDLQLFSRSEIAAHKNIDGITRDIALYVLDECLSSWEQIPTSVFK
jgi:8-oxo-dGTP pyrophosphatase MutT (NUDIX family)